MIEHFIDHHIMHKCKHIKETYWMSVGEKRHLRHMPSRKHNILWWGPADLSFDKNGLMQLNKCRTPLTIDAYKYNDLVEVEIEYWYEEL